MIEYLWQVMLVFIIEITLFGGGVYCIIRNVIDYFELMSLVFGSYLISIGITILVWVLELKI